jgi:hypothetical protein
MWPARRGAILLALSLLALGAAGLRVAAHDWDQGQHLHPDEVSVTQAALDRAQWPPGTPITQFFDPAHSPLNPRASGAAYPYGALPLYLAKIPAVALAALTGDAGFSGYDGVLQTGRVLAGLFDVLTLLLVFAVGARLWGAGAGLVAAALYAGAVLPIQIAHFYISEPFMTAFMTATLLGSVLFVQTGRARFLALAALCAGLAMACKISALPVLALPLAAVLAHAWAHRRATGRQWVGWLVVVLLGAGVGLFLGDPYGVLDAPTYLAQIGQQAAIQSGATDVWYTRRFVGTWPVIFPWGQLVLVGAGPLVGLAGTVGAGLVAAQAGRRRDGAAGLLVVGGGVYFLSIAFLDAKWVRYVLPLVPYLCLFATALGFWILDFGFWKRVNARWLRYAPLALLLGSAGAGALAFSTVYAAENTRVQASRWIYAHVPPGSHIVRELNDTPLPLALPGAPAPDQAYTLSALRLLGDQSSAEVAAMLQSQLSAADFVIVGSGRSWRTVPRLPWRYPVQIRYYDLLFSGQLGFTPVYTASAYPTLGPFAVRDDHEPFDLSFTEYDHPAVRIFQKQRPLSPAEWTALFADAVRRPSLATRSAP